MVSPIAKCLKCHIIGELERQSCYLNSLTPPPTTPSWVVSLLSFNKDSYYIYFKLSYSLHQ